MLVANAAYLTNPRVQRYSSAVSRSISRWQRAGSLLVFSWALALAISSQLGATRRTEASVRPPTPPLCACDNYTVRKRDTRLVGFIWYLQRPTCRTDLSSCLACCPFAAIINRHAAIRSEQRANQRPVPVQEWGQSYVDGLQSNWRHYLQMDLANSTHKAYDYHQRQFKEFCRMAGFPPRPEPRALAQFVIGRAEHGYALSTIEQGVYAVARMALDQGVEGLTSDLEVKRAMKVACKLAGPCGQAEAAVGSPGPQAHRDDISRQRRDRFYWS